MSSVLSKIKNIGIFGLGRTGTASYRALKDLISNVVCFDDNEATIQRFVDVFGAEDVLDLENIKWQKLDAILLSPGIPPSHRIVALASEHKIAITSDVDLFFELVNKKNFISITGTNGKSTTTSLVGHIFNSSGVNYQVGGNIGTALFDLDQDKDGYIVELSSFQLDLLTQFKAKIAVLLNITPDHLDHHKTMANYIDAKKKIFNNMDKSCFGVINIDNKITNNIYHELDCKDIVNLIPISTEQILKNGISVLNNIVYDNFFDRNHYGLIYNEHLLGTHNNQNIAASYCIARIRGLSVDKILSSIASFKGLDHRMQYVASAGKVKMYNDSKATNSDAAEQSLRALDNIYWIAGGIAKTGGIESLEPYFYKITKAYLYGTDIDILAKTLENKVAYKKFENLEQAFEAAFADAIEAESPSNVLLAPACASLDQFKNFEERGNLFIKLSRNKILNYE